MEPLHGAVRSDEQQDLSLVRAQKSVCLLTATKPIRAGRDGGGRRAKDGEEMEEGLEVQVGVT